MCMSSVLNVGLEPTKILRDFAAGSVGWDGIGIRPGANVLPRIATKHSD